MPRNKNLRFIDDMDLAEARSIRKKCQYMKQRDVAKQHNISHSLVYEIVHFKRFPEPTYWDTLLTQKTLGGYI